MAQLRQRDLREKEPFAEMMAAHHALAERSDALQAENRQLQFTCERLKIDGGDGSGGREAILQREMCPDYDFSFNVKITEQVTGKVL